MATKTLETRKMTWDAMNDFCEKQKLTFKETDKDNIYLIKDGRKNVGYVELSEEAKPKQVHISRDRDIKIDSKKVGDYNIKLIYHRMKDDSKQYRIYISYKGDDGKLIRKRYVGDDIKNVQDNEKKSIDVFNKLDVKAVKKVI